MSAPPYSVHEISGAAFEPWLDALGELRIRVFREFPYLYDGTPDYERGYLRGYRDTPEAFAVLVTDGDGRLVAASTCIPLVAAGLEFSLPFAANGFDLRQVLYLAESAALPEWRGLGLGHLFFDRREAHARRLGLPITAFCAVDRPDGHLRRPADYRPLDGFWQRRGYQRQAGLQAVFHWQETGECGETQKTMTFWLKQ